MADLEHEGSGELVEDGVGVMVGGGGHVAQGLARHHHRTVVGVQPLPDNRSNFQNDIDLKNIPTTM